MSKRQWRIEYMNAEGAWIGDGSYRYKTHAALVMAGRIADQPGVMFRLVKHVDFDAAT